MNETLKNTIFIISIILSLTIILVQYFQIDRYTLLNNSNIDIKKEVENYKNIPHHDKENTIAIGYILQKPIEEIIPSIKSIFDQTVKIDKIYIIQTGDFISQNHPIRKYLNVIDWKKQIDEENPLPIFKLIENDANTKLIILKNDIIYGTDFIEHMISQDGAVKDKDTKCFSLLPSQQYSQCKTIYFNGNNYKI